MQFVLLGALRVRQGPQVTTISSPGQRILLAALLMRPNVVISADELAQLVWAGQPLSDARRALHNQVMRLRRTLGRAADRVVTRHPGYLIRADSTEVDVMTFAELVERGSRLLRDRHWDKARLVLDEALGLWRGEPLEDVDSPHLRRAAAYLHDLRERARRDYIEAELGAGNFAAVIPRLRGEIAERPLVEQPYGQLMLALAGSGRRPEALRLYREAERRFVDALGLEPSAALQAVQAAILDGTQPAVPTASPPLPFQLPRDLPDLVGRQEEIRALVGLLTAPGPAARHAVIHGAGGTGKTALAVHVGHRLRADFPDGVLFADLRGVDPEPLPAGVVLARFLRALGVFGASIPPQVDERAALFRSLLRQRRVLVVLDNASSAGQLDPLLPTRSGCAALITSRRRVPEPLGTQAVELGLLDLAEAVDLLERVVGGARASRADFAGLARACGRLPLAVRIAAARLGSRTQWSVPYLTARLAAQRPLDELSVGDLDVRVSFRASYLALPAPHARAFRQLALAPQADLSVRVASAALDLSPDETQRILVALVDASLLVGKDPDRYTYHDLLRLFAREHAAQEDPPEERAGVVIRAVEAVLDDLEGVTPALRPPVGPPTRGHPAPQPNTPEARSWLDLELANIVACVREVAHDPALPARLAGRLCELLQRHLILAGNWDDLRLCGELTLRAARRDDDHYAESVARRALGRYAMNGGDLTTALEHLEQSLHLARASGDPACVVHSLNALGPLHAAMRELGRAREVLEEALKLSREQDTPHSSALAANFLGQTHLAAGDIGLARERLCEGLRLARATGDPALESMALYFMGDVHSHLGDHDQAVGYVTSALRLTGARGNQYSHSVSLMTLGRVLLAAGRAVEAAQAFESSAELHRRHGSPAQAALLLGEAAAAYRTATDPDAAARAEALAVRLHNEAGPA